MTVSANVRKAGPYTGNGSATSFAFNFKATAKSDLRVVRTVVSTGVESDLVLDSDYSVTLNPDQEAAPGGSVTYPLSGSAMASTHKLTIVSNLAITQTTDITNGGGFYPQVIEDALDRLTMLAGQLQEQINRAVRVDVSSTTDPANLLDEITTAKNDAQTAATNAAASLDSFDDRYLGAKASDPTVDNDGAALITGALYFNTTAGEMRVYNGTQWGSVASVAYVPTTFSGNGSTTAFTLPVAPVSKNNVFVHFDAAYQFKAGFSVSGTTLTFTSAPPAGANNIEVLIAQPLPVASADAENVTLTLEAEQVTLADHLRGNGVETPTRRGFWTDDASGANIHRLRDRVFIGDGVLHTGRRTAPLGGTWLETILDGWFEKNSQAIITSSNGRMALLGASRSGTSTSVGSTIGVSGVAVNDLVAGLAWGMYSDITRKEGAGTTYGIEFACKNQGDNVNGTAYALSGGVIGAHIVAGGDPSYGGAATNPSTCAVNVASGAGPVSWNIGIRFSASAITGTDGVTGTGVAIAFAKGHTLQWRASDVTLGATLRSDVSNVAGQDTGLIFANNKVRVTGTAEVDIATFSRDTAGAGPVNYIDFKNARTNVAPTISVGGSDAAVPLAMQTKSTGVMRFMSHDGTSEHLRITPGASAAINYLTVKGGPAGNPTTIGAAGSDTNIDIQVTPKGTGLLRFGAFTANADAPITGYVTIKTDDGTVRKLAVIA